MAYIKFQAAIIATCLALTGCSSETPPEDRTDAGEPTDIEAPIEPKEETENPADMIYIQKLSALLETNPEPDQLAAFMKENLKESAPDEADLTLSRFILAQNLYAQTWNSMLFDGRVKGYQEMGFTWDITKIQDISDSDLRNEYLKLVDSYMRIVTYEETPVVEPDWARLGEFKGYASKEIDLMIDIRRKIQNYEYGTDPFNFEEMAQDIVSLEAPIMDRHSGYMTHLMNQCYNRLISEFYLSIEGMNAMYWGDADSDLVQVAEEYAQNEPDSAFGKLCRSFMDMRDMTAQGEQLWAFSDTISNFNIFGLQSSLTIDQVSTVTKNYERDLRLLTSPLDSRAESRINERIESELKEMQTELNWTPESQGRLRESNYIIFSSGKYFSTSIFVSLNTDESNYVYKERFLTFDLDTGRVLTLSDLFSKPRDAYESQLVEAIKNHNPVGGIDFSGLNALPEELDYQLHPMGMVIYFPQSFVSPDHPYDVSIYLPHSALAEIFDPMSLYE